ncbi:MAG: 3-oxoacyl-ACP reductase [Candidatus Reconcilbacillus cellulovorans]|uniref:3-oxoacyl-ACP reductase n=1 Tax=Candidatus Reconcilbacillus cellulovorans TaxID=1906605 RepID=A0A2A6E421_9BACL|nr:MAG: 3-oxoacyl-ACP reductase [Candidatus Reconcilbacillus cellulovorans]
MDLGLKGRKALVTASSRGIGRAIAEALAREGADVGLCGRNQAAVYETARRLRETYGVDAWAVAADVGRRDDIEGLVGEAARRWGRIDALVCNAGGPPGGSFLTLSDEEWEAAFRINVMSVVRLTRSVYPLMRDGGGRIVAVASTSVKMPIPRLVLSNAMRSAVAAVMKTLSIEWGKDGILVNTICPGRIRTDRTEELDRLQAREEGKSVAEVRAAIEAQIPLGRYGEPEELARLAAFLLSPANTYVTGSLFYVDGGMVKAM